MNGNELFVYVVLPLLIAAFGVAVAYLYGRGVKHDDRSPGPGE